MRRIIRLTEGNLHRVIKESVNKLLKEEELATKKEYTFSNAWGEFREGDYDPNSSKVAIICWGHGDYDDSDHAKLVYDLEKHKFILLYDTTRYGVPPEKNDLHYKYRVLNECDETILDEIRNAARNKKPVCAIKAIQELKYKYPHKYQQESLSALQEEMLQLLPKVIEEDNSILELVSLFYGTETGDFLRKVMEKLLNLAKTQIVQHPRKQRKVTVSGNEYTGTVFYVKEESGRYGAYYKVGMNMENEERGIWMILSNAPKKGEEITVVGQIDSESPKYISLRKTKRIDNIDPSLIEYE
jgi:hypothetical protein